MLLVGAVNPAVVASAELPVLELVVALVGVEGTLPGAVASGAVHRAAFYKGELLMINEQPVSDLLLVLNRKQSCSSSSPSEGEGDLFLLVLPEPWLDLLLWPPRDPWYPRPPRPPLGLPRRAEEPPPPLTCLARRSYFFSMTFNFLDMEVTALSVVLALALLWSIGGLP